MTELRDEQGTFRYLGTTNTQTRRLGYLVALVDILKESYLPREALVRRLRRWAESAESYLNAYKSDKGAIRTNRAANRYISLAEDLGLVGNINNYLRPTEYGRVAHRNNKSDNPFQLGESKVLLTYLVFTKDADYELVSLQLVHKHRRQKSILNNSQSLLESHLEERLKTGDKRNRKEAIKRLEEIRSWKSPSSYSEHIFIPRIHWLIDLGLVELADVGRAAYELTEVGRRILSSLRDGEDYPRISRYWCENLLFTNWKRESEDRAVWKELTEEGQKQILSTYLNLAFQHLRTSSHNRISARQFIVYCTTKVNYHLNISCGFSDIKATIRYIERVGELDIDFYWTEKKNSGYIIKQ